MENFIETKNITANHKMGKKSVLMKKRNINWQLYVLIAPALLWIFIFSYLPMGGLIIAFKKFNYAKGIFGSPWVGLDNFAYLFESQVVTRIVRNTICYNLMFIVAGIIVALIVALMLDYLRSKILVKIFQTAYFLPYFVSWVVVGFIASLMFDYDYGVFNQIATFFGGEKVSWYQEKGMWWWILLSFNIWKNVGFQSVIYLGAIAGIPTDLYESATLDGCGGFQKIRYITLPLLRPTVIILAIMAVGGILRADFGLFYYIPNNTQALYEVTDVIDTYIFRALSTSGNLSVSSAVGFVQSVVGLLLVLLVNTVVRKIESESALF